MADIDQMLANHEADSWDSVGSTEQHVFEDETKDPLTRVDAYVDHCFEVYDVVSTHLDRSQVQVCVADWDKRRGQARKNRRMGKRDFGKRVSNSAWEQHEKGHYSLFMAKALVGVPPEDDKGVGWKSTVRHELGHLIDYERRGTSGHGPKFKEVMSLFGHDVNDGAFSHGYYPRYHEKA